MSIRLDEMTWPEVEEALKKPNVVILPVGSTEQHGTHLPLNVDAVEATYLSEAVAKKTTEEHQDITVLVAPTMPYGDVSVHKMFPGTIGVKIDTLIKMIEDITKSFLEQGFNNIVVFVSHVENECPVEAALRKVADEYPKARLFALSILGLGREKRAGLYKAGPAGIGHALEGETAMSLVMQPQNVKLDKATKGRRKLPLSEKHIGKTGTDRTKGVLYYSGVRGWEESGIMGDPTMSTREQGENIIEAITEDFTDILIELMQPKDP